MSEFGPIDEYKDLFDNAPCGYLTIGSDGRITKVNATLTAWTGIAAFWSGDSIAPPGQPPIAPLPQQTGSAVAAAVSLAAVRGDGKRYPERLRRFLGSGRDIASGGNGRLSPEVN